MILSKKIREKQYDFGFLLTNTIFDALCFKLGRVKKIIGYNKEARGFMLDYKEDIDRKSHYVNRYAHIVNAGLGKPCVKLAALKLYTNLEKSLINSAAENRNIGLYFGSEQKGQRAYSKTEAAKVLTSLGRASNYYFSLLGDKSEVQYNEDIINLISPELRQRCTNLTGETTINTLVNTIASLSIIITIDSGPLHIAAATGIPFVALVGKGAQPYSLTEPRVDFGISLRESASYIDDGKRMQDIDAERVVQAAESILLKNQR